MGKCEHDDLYNFVVLESPRRPKWSEVLKATNNIDSEGDELEYIEVLGLKQALT